MLVDFTKGWWCQSRFIVFVPFWRSLISHLILQTSWHRKWISSLRSASSALFCSSCSLLYCLIKFLSSLYIYRFEQTILHFCVHPRCILCIGFYSCSASIFLMFGRFGHFQKTIDLDFNSILPLLSINIPANKDHKRALNMNWTCIFSLDINATSRFKRDV